MVFFDKKAGVLKKFRQDNNKMDRKSLTKVPTWIQLPNLPPKMCSVQGLSQIGSIVSRPIEADIATEDRTRMSFARILVDVKNDEGRQKVIQYLDRKSRSRSGDDYGRARGLALKERKATRPAGEERSLKVAA